MKKTFLIPVFLLSAGAVFSGTEENTLVSSKGIILDHGVIRLAGEPVTLFKDDFSGGTKQWPKVVSYKNTIQMRSSKDGLKLTNGNPKESDNAWELISADLPLNPEFREYTFTLRARRKGSNIPMQGHGESYWNRLEWIGRDGKVLKLEPFNFPSGKVSEATLESTIPEDACAVRIRIGCDTPNMGAKDEILIEQVKLQFFTGKGKIKTEGVAESTPLLVQKGEFLEWKGETPPGTELLFQLSFADDDHGFPGVWSPFRGPDQDEKEWYVSEGKKYIWFGRDRAKLYPEITKPCWVRWRAKLIPNPRMNTAPSLEQVVIGDERSEAWTEKSDRQVPIVRFICRTPSENPGMPFAFVVTDNTAVDWKSVKITVDGIDVTKQVEQQGNMLTYMPEKPWTMGIHATAITLKDINGQQISSQSFFCCGPRRAERVIIRQDGGIKVDGKPFFPIGVYSVAKRDFNQFSFDKAMKDLKGIGINMVHTYNDRRNENFREFLEAAAKNNMKLFISCGSGSNGKELRPMLETIRKEHNNTSILAWYIGDDTSMHIPPAEMRQRGEAVRNMDPTRPTAQADAVGSRKPRSNYRDYVFATDIFMPELYPVMENTKEDADLCAARVVQDMKKVQSDLHEAHAARKSIWPIIQYFKGWKSWKRYPTEKELRAMTFASLVTGANGIVWYTYTPGDTVKNHGITATEESWKTFASVSKEISALADVLAEERPDIESNLAVISGAAINALKDPSIVYEIRKSLKRTLLIAVNTANAPVTAEFTVPGYTKAVPVNGVKIAEAKKGFFSSIFKSKETFTVHFEPLGTAVYELKN